MLPHGLSPYYTFELDDTGSIQMLDADDKAVGFTVEAVTEYLGGADKYAEVVRALARNETVDTTSKPKRKNAKTHFGIR